MDKPIFWATLVVLFLVCIPLVHDPVSGNRAVSEIYGAVTEHLPLDQGSALTIYWLANAPFGACGHGVSPGAHSLGCVARTLCTASCSHAGGFPFSSRP